MSLALSEECVRQAKVLYDLRFSQVFGLDSFERYLKGTDSVQGIMEIPVWPKQYPDYLDRNVLVDGRVLERVGLKEFCRLCGIVYDGEDDTFVPYDPAQFKTGLRWMRAHIGVRNRNIAPSTCRERFARCEVGLNDVEGISIYLQDRSILKGGHVMDLPESVYAADRGVCAFLKQWGVRPRLRWYWGVYPDPRYGSASRGT